MIPCNVVEIETPKRVRLNGLWFGTKKPKRVIVWVHGLGGSAFSRKEIVALLAKGDTAVLVFNNRGHDLVSRFTRGKKSVTAGAANEVFAECVDDIDGAVSFARAQGAKKICLAGHSTGCQKSVYWAAKKRGKGVGGLILLAPIADYAGMSAEEKGMQPRAAGAARALVAAGKPHELLPPELWPSPIDAQRFLSLYTSDSVEQSIFSYFDPAKTPRILRSVRVPLLVLLAEKDEYADHPAEKIAAWFEQCARSHVRTDVIPAVAHNFKGAEEKVAHAILRWIRGTA